MIDMLRSTADVFVSGGYFMWPILAAGVIVLVRAGDACRKLLGALDASSDELRSGIDAVLFWGGFAAVLGVLGTAGGLAQMVRAIASAGAVSPELAWGGLGVTLITTLFGLGTFAVALLLWFALLAGLRRRRRDAAGG